MPDQNNNQPNNVPPSSKPRLDLRSDVGKQRGGSFNFGGPQPLNAKNKKTLTYIASLVLVLIIVGLGVYAALRPKQDTPAGEDGGIFGELPLGGERPEEPATTTSGLSGRTCEHHSRRPVGVMLAGDPINRPVSGFAKADLVFELPVLTSGVTRLLAVYQCGQPADIGSVRSARHDYLFLAEGVDAIVAHWGGSYHALNRIAVGEFQTLNALTNPHNAFFRKNNLPAPYNGFTTYDRLWNAIEKLGLRTTTEFEGYEFKDDPAAEARPAGGTLSIAWPGQFRVHYEYDPATNRYQRFWAGTKQVDGEDGAAVAPSVVAIMRATNGFAEGPGGYNDVGIEGEGAAEVYQDGQVIKGTWRKDERFKNDPVHFLNEAGEEITFTRGQVWIMAVEPNVTVTWEPPAAAPTQ